MEQICSIYPSPEWEKKLKKTLKKEKRESSPTEQNDPTEEVESNAIHKDDVNGKSVTMLRWDSQCRGDKVCHPT